MQGHDFSDSAPPMQSGKTTAVAACETRPLSQADLSSSASCVLIVLGAGGYLGGEIASRFYGRPGFHVIGVFRTPPRRPSCDEVVVRDAFAHDLRDLVAAHGRVVLINAAFDFGDLHRGFTAAHYASLETALHQIASRPGGTCINISSMSAFGGCRSDYGRAKLQVEALFARHRGINVRPGLVVSWQRPGSAFLRLLDIARSSPIVPVLTAGNDGFFICDLDLLIAGIETLIGMRVNKSHTLSFCYTRRIRLAALLRLIAARLRRRLILIPVPWRLAYWMILAKEQMTGKAKIRADSIIDFAFPAVVAPRRRFYARLARRSSPPGSGDDGTDFSSLEAASRGRLAR